MQGIFNFICRTARPLQLVFLLLASTTGRIPPVLAHGEEIAVGGGARGPVVLTEQQQQAIDLKTTAADFRTLDQILNVNGEVQLLPQNQAVVSARISGQVLALYVRLGDKVKRGQALVKVESRISGNPPPSVVVAAPMDGVVDESSLMLGQSVEPNVSLFHISDRSRVIVAARLYEEDLGKVQIGMDARVRALGYPQQLFSGKITLIEPQLDPQTRTIKVWIEVANPRNLLRPNLFARASILLQHNEAALAVPNGAVMQANGENFVFVREAKQFRRVEVSLGVADDLYTEITSELVPGDEVVTQGNRELYTMWLTGGQMKGEDD